MVRAKQSKYLYTEPSEGFIQYTIVLSLPQIKLYVYFIYIFNMIDNKN